MVDFFESQLLECQWRSIGIPVSSFHVKISQSIAKHQRPDQDGARIESTGREPLVFSATIPFRNNISKGKNESWGVLYPDTHRKFLAAMADRSAGTLQHPSLGLILCKAVSCDSSLESGKRDGEDVTAEWIETRDEDDILNAVLSQSSPIGTAVLNAIDLDTRLSQTNFGGFDPDANDISFEEALRRVAGVFDKASLLSRKSFGIIDRIVYRIDTIKNAVVALRDPQNWPLKEALSKLKDSVLALKRAALAGQKDVRIYIVPAPSTLGNIAAKLKNRVGDIIRLNPSLVNTPQVPAKTVVRYFVSVN